MPTEPDPVLRLLWRHLVPSDGAPRRSGPRRRLDVDDVVDQAIELAGVQGLSGLSMRALATRLGVVPMSLYTYVGSRNDLLVLMVDQAVGRRALPPLDGSTAESLRQVAAATLEDARDHPWLLDVSGVRPWLGPCMAARYEWQLGAVEGIGLTDVEMDQVVTLVVGLATSVARSEHAARAAAEESGLSDLDWWQANAGTLGELSAHGSYPLAGRVGQAAGEAYQAGRDPALELTFGLDRVIDGVRVLLDGRPTAQDGGLPGA